MGETPLWDATKLSALCPQNINLENLLDALSQQLGHALPPYEVERVADEDWDKGLSKEDGLWIANKLISTNNIDFLNIIRGHIDTDASLTKVIPTQGMPSSPHLDFASEIKIKTKFPRFMGKT